MRETYDEFDRGVGSPRTGSPLSFGEFFTPLQEGLLSASTQAGWGGYRRAQTADIFQTGQRGLLDLTGKRQEQKGRSLFAGSGIPGREYGRGRSQLQQGLLRGMFGLEQDILGKIGIAQSKIEDWRQSQIGIGLKLMGLEAKGFDMKNITNWIRSQLARKTEVDDTDITAEEPVEPFEPEEGWRARRIGV